MTDARLMVAMAFAGIAGAVTLAALAMLGQQGHEDDEPMQHMCLTCRYKHGIEHTDPADDMDYECRRHAPAAMNTGEPDCYVTLWPEVNAFDTCAEWKEEHEAQEVDL